MLKPVGHHYCVCGHMPDEHHPHTNGCAGVLDDGQPCTCMTYEHDKGDEDPLWD